MHKKTVSFADGYKIVITLDRDGDVEVVCYGSDNWERIVKSTFTESRYWKLKKAPKALQKALAIIKTRREYVRKFNEELVPDFEALCEVTQAVAELEEELA